tara:strand:+ start:3861 stop:4400 length:540 start_codon:yes stop_codon:yes gene_type:complete
MKLPKYPQVKGYWKETKRLLESQAYNELTLTQLKVLKYLYLRNKFTKQDGKYISTNNGEIDVAMSVMMKDLNIKSQETITQAIRQLVTVGFIDITRYGYNKTTHNYKVLLEPACKRQEEKWRQYPKKNWKHNAPRRKNPLPNGENTWKQNFKHKPKEVESKTANKPNGLDRTSVRSLIE